MPHGTALRKEKTHQLQHFEQVSFMAGSGKCEKRNAERSAGHRDALRHTEENKKAKARAAEEWERGS